MKKLVVAAASTLALVFAAPAHAVNHPFVPAEECAVAEGAGGEEAAPVLFLAPGQPFVKRLEHVPQPPQGQDRSSATGHCKNE